MARMSEAPKPDSGTVERFRVVMLPHLDAAYGFARWLTRDPIEAQDLAQEAMLRALRYFHAFRGEEARPWLLRIVRNTWVDLRRKRGTDQPLEVVENRPADGLDPEQSALAGDQRRQMARALETCPDCRQRLEAARTMSGLLRELPAELAPDLLRARVERELRTIAGRPRERMRWGAVAASLVVAAGIGWLGGALTGESSRN